MRKLDKKQVTDMIKGKSVVILGSAPSVLYNNRTVIEKHDIVVRLNNFKTSGYEQKVGARTDIYYSFFGSSIKKTAADLKGVRLIYCKYPDCDFREHNDGRYEDGVSGDFRSVYKFRQRFFNSLNTDIYIPDYSDFLRNFLYANRILTTGVQCIIDILSHNPKSIHVTGFDFFESGKHNTNERWTAGDGGHDHNAEKDIVKNITKYFNVTLDDNIKETLCL